MKQHCIVEANKGSITFFVLGGTYFLKNPILFQQPLS